MKELSIEEKAKRFEDALKRAKECHIDGLSLHQPVKDVIEHIFHELKESEDEKIRKELLEHCRKQAEMYNTLLTAKEYSKVQSWITWLEKQGEQKTTDNEPKFKVGDILVSEEEDRRHIYKVEAITNYDTYLLLDLEDGYTRNESVYICDLAMYLWTIQDAKDGDVLVCNINKAEIGGDIEKLPNITQTICIYQNVVKDHDYIHSYCSLYDGSSLVLQNTMYYNTFVYNIHPATKEQRDLLFSKMKEERCEWDAEKKELRKIEQKSAWSEEDENAVSVLRHIIKQSEKIDSNIYTELVKEKLFDWLKSLRQRIGG